jgi:hypothetical protein
MPPSPTPLRHDLAVETGPSEVWVARGDVIELTITIDNVGQQDAGEPHLAFSLPDDALPLSIPDGCVAWETGTYDCPLGELPAGAQIQRTLSFAIVGFNSQIPRAFEANVSDAEIPEIGGDNSLTQVTIHLVSPGLRITITPASTTVDIGDQVVLTATARVVGRRDTVDPELRFSVSDTMETIAIPAACESNAEFDQHTCPIDALPAGGRYRASITVRLVRADQPENSRVSATITDRDIGAFAAASAIISAPSTSDLFVKAPPVTAVVSDPPVQFEITATVGNAGPNDAGEVMLVFSFGETRADWHLSPLQHLLPDNCEREGEEGPPLPIVCTIPSLQVGERVKVTLPVDIFRRGRNPYHTYEVHVSVRLLSDGEFEAVRDRQNSRATLKVDGVPPHAANPTPPAPGGSGGSSPGAGGLPLTGGNIIRLVTIGLALLGAGTTSFLLTRRRRRNPAGTATEPA